MNLHRIINQAISLSFLVLIVMSCKKKETDPDFEKPDLRIEKVTPVNTLTEGSFDTIYFKVSLDKPFSGQSIEVHLEFGYLTGVKGDSIFTETKHIGENGLTSNFMGVGTSVSNFYYVVRLNEGETEKVVGIRARENTLYDQGKEYKFGIVKAIYWKDDYGMERSFTSNYISYLFEDNDTPPIIGFDHSFSGTTSVQEANGQDLWVRVHLSAFSGVSTEVDFTITGTATSGTDYTMKSSSPLVIPAMQDYADIKFDLINDAVYEGNEKFIIQFSNPQNAIIGIPANSTTLRGTGEVVIYDEEDQK